MFVKLSNWTEKPRILLQWREEGEFSQWCAWWKNNSAKHAYENNEVIRNGMYDPRPFPQKTANTNLKALKNLAKKAMIMIIIKEYEAMNISLYLIHTHTHRNRHIHSTVSPFYSCCLSVQGKRESSYVHLRKYSSSMATVNSFCNR